MVGLHWFPIQLTFLYVWHVSAFSSSPLPLLPSVNSFEVSQAQTLRSSWVWCIRSFYAPFLTAYSTHCLCSSFIWNLAQFLFLSYFNKRHLHCRLDGDNCRWRTCLRVCVYVFGFLCCWPQWIIFIEVKLCTIQFCLLQFGREQQ